MIRKTLAAAALMAGLTAAQWAVAQTAPLPVLGFKLGDDVATVKAALRTNAEPEPIARNPLLPANAPDINRGKTVLHLRTKGVWVFFSPTGSVDTVRLDAPFAGDVLGVKLGDTIKQVTEKRGNPIRKPGVAFMTMQSYQYAIDDSAYVNYVANDDGVQMIFITK
jgi:hypothetical protein